MSWVSLLLYGTQNCYSSAQNVIETKFLYSYSKINANDMQQTKPEQFLALFFTCKQKWEFVTDVFAFVSTA